MNTRTPGFLSILRSKSSRGILLLLFLSILFLAGCAAPREAEKAETTAPTLAEFLARSEASFDPADYDPDIDALRRDVREHRAELEAARVATIAVPETIPGFRVQVLFTHEIDLANRMRRQVEDQLPDDWVYVVYEAPYYKVRVGNFPDRTSATPMLKQLESLGYKDSWIVPDHIIKNYPPKPPQLEIEPDNRFKLDR